MRGLKVTRAVPEKHMINFFGLTVQTSSEIIEHYSNMLLKSTASLINIVRWLNLQSYMWHHMSNQAFLSICS